MNQNNLVVAFWKKKPSYWEDTKTMWTIFRRNNLVPAKTDTINIVNDLEHLPVSLTWHRMCVSWELILRRHPLLSENVNCSASIHVPHILASIWLLSSAPPPPPLLYLGITFGYFLKRVPSAPFLYMYIEMFWNRMLNILHQVTGILMHIYILFDLTKKAMQKY